MKRFAVTTVLAVAAMLPAIALATTYTETGTLSGDSGASISMKVKVNHKGKPTKVVDFEAADVELQCDGDDPTMQFTFDGVTAFPVDGTKFHGYAGVDGYGSDSYTDVNGNLKSKGKKADGTIEIYGFYPTDSTGHHPECYLPKTKFSVSK